MLKDKSENWFGRSPGGEMEIQRSIIEGGTFGVLPAREGTLGYDKALGAALIMLCLLFWSGGKG